MTSKSVGVPRDDFALAREGIGVTSNSSLFLFLCLFFSFCVWKACFLVFAWFVFCV